MILRILSGGIFIGGIAAAPVMAQVLTPPITEHQITAAVEHQYPPQVFVETVVEAKITTGRPYSAEATTEFVQVLGDGNRISRRSVVRIYRDGEGRTRREELGPDGTPVSMSIYDPVAHVSYVLHPATRTAQKSAIRVMLPAKIAEAGAKASVEREVAVAGKIALVDPTTVTAHAAEAEVMHKQHAEAGAHAIAVSPTRAALVVSYTAHGHAADAESLGEKMIEGLTVEGTMKKLVIPAGSIGNQDPMTVISEQWFSPDLAILVMTKHSDPRTGETTYTLSNIVRGEPSPTLFEVPSDYTVKASPYMKLPAFD